MAFGTHFTDSYAGRVFFQSTSQASVAGLAIPIFSNTAAAGGNPLWNPPGSNRVVEVISLDVQYASGTADYASLGIMMGPVAAIGTATGCSVLTSATPFNAYMFGGSASKIYSANGGTVTVTAGIATPPVPGVVGAGWVRNLGAINLEAQTGTAHGTTGGPTYNFNGTLILPPGVIMYLAAVKASVALYNLTWCWKEIPIVAGQA